MEDNPVGICQDVGYSRRVLAESCKIEFSKLSLNNSMLQRLLADLLRHSRRVLRHIQEGRHIGLKESGQTVGLLPIDDACYSTFRISEYIPVIEVRVPGHGRANLPSSSKLEKSAGAASRYYCKRSTVALGLASLHVPYGKSKQVSATSGS